MNKKLVLGMLGMLYMQVAANLHAQVLTGKELELGATGSNQVQVPPGQIGAAVGTGNVVTGGNSMAIGENADMASCGDSLVVGIGNSTYNTSHSFAAGYHNSLGGSGMVMFGAYNASYYYDDFGAGVDGMLVGQYNYNSGSTASLAAGVNNYLASGIANIALGQGLLNGWSNCTVVGQYNEYFEGAALVFVVGNGTNSGNRSNALEVYRDGTIKMPPQGDISMGEFGP
jgi:hypothetical protein